MIRPFDEDCGELSRAEMRAQRIVWTPDLDDRKPTTMRAQAPDRLSEDEWMEAYGIRDGAAPYPGTIAYPILYGICALLAITGVGGLWMMFT